MHKMYPQLEVLFGRKNPLSTLPSINSYRRKRRKLNSGSVHHFVQNRSPNCPPGLGLCRLEQHRRINLICLGNIIQRTNSVSTIKHHFLPDSDTAKAIFVLIFILTIRLFLSKSPTSIPQGSHHNPDSPILELTNKYLDSTTEESVARPQPFSSPNPTQWTKWNLRPTDPNIMYGHPDQ